LTLPRGRPRVAFFNKKHNFDGGTNGGVEKTRACQAARDNREVMNGCFTVLAGIWTGKINYAHSFKYDSSTKAVTFNLHDINQLWITVTEQALLTPSDLAEVMAFHMNVQVKGNF